jgi:hypothetical protein
MLLLCYESLEENEMRWMVCCECCDVAMNLEENETRKENNGKIRQNKRKILVVKYEILCLILNPFIQFIKLVRKIGKGKPY